MPKTGATRYQKFLKKEKAKTKLKAKKDLPVGTNVTKTNFKVKKIAIKEQLKQHSQNEALSLKKLNASELLSRLSHSNVNSLTGALDGLKELITSHAEVLDQYLGRFIEGVAPLILHTEKSVRHKALKVMYLMLSNTVTENNVKPFFHIMSVYLRSGMTNIDFKIQEDSLLFMDSLLMCTPKLVTEDFHKIFPNYLSMISKLRVDSKPGRTLTIQLEKQTTSVKWRVKVLHCLQDFLQKFVDFHNDAEKTIKQPLIFFDHTKLNHYSLFDPTYTSVCSLSCFSGEKPIDEAEKFKTYVDTLMPLLFETWLEATPSGNFEKAFETLVSEDAALLLRYILKIISLLRSILQYLIKKNPDSQVERELCSKYQKIFSLHFVIKFPYVTNVRSRNNKDKSGSLPFDETILDSKLVAENLEICHLFIALSQFASVKHNQQREIISVLNYVESSFNKSSKDLKLCDRVISILTTIFSDKIHNLTKTLFIMESLFRKIILACFDQHICTSLREKIFNLLCKISLNDKLKYFNQSDAYKEWLKNLPNIFLQESLSIESIEILYNFVLQNNEVFNQVVTPKLVNVIGNLPKIVISDFIDISNYHRLYAIFHWIKKWDDESLNLIEKQLQEGIYKDGQFFVNILKSRAVKEEEKRAKFKYLPVK